MFSFGILCFELVAETLKPYGDKSFYGIEYKVAKNPLLRPQFSIEYELPNEQLWAVDLMQRCWNHNSAERPGFAAIVKEIQDKMQM